MEYTAGRGTTAMSIIGTALGGLAVAGNGLLGGLNMGCTRNVNGEDGCSENHLVNRYEAAQAANCLSLLSNAALNRSSMRLSCC